MVDGDETRMTYLKIPISKAIINAIGDSTLAFSQVVSKTGFPSAEVATWLLDMKTKGLLSHSIKLPITKEEAMFSLSPEGRELVCMARHLWGWPANNCRKV